MDWVGYSTPLSAAKAYMDEETANDPVAYPSEEILANGQYYLFLPPEVSRHVEGLFMGVRNG